MQINVIFYLRWIIGLGIFLADGINHLG